MKKLFSAFTAVLLAFCFISCAPQELSDRSSKNEGSVSLSIRSPRTISPAEGISYKDVPEWTVTFQDKNAKYDVITVENVNFNSSPQEIRLPLGTYNVTLNGTANNSTLGETAQPVPFYGEASVTVEGGTSVPISVFVAPKQSGTGSFNFTVTTSGEFGNYTPVVSGNYFTVSLTPYGGEKPTATWTPTPTEISGSVIETGSSYLFSVSSETLESKSVPSGFYTLSIKYTWVVGTDSDKKTKEIFYPYHDFLVEIVDECTTTGSVEITVSLEDSKIYYATKGETIGNGAFESMPKNLDELLVDINRTTISTANIYIVDEVLTDETSTSYPEIDVSKVNATGKTYKIYTKNKDSGSYEAPCYTITGAAVEGGEPTIDIERSVTTITLKNSQSSSGISGRAKIVALGSPEFVLKDNTSVFIDLTDQNNQIACTTICMPPDSTTFDSYYVENPCVTVKNHSTTQTIFSVFVEQSLSNSYSVVTKSSDDGIYKTTNFYIIPSYKAGLSVEGIPKYSLVATTKYGESVTDDTPLYAGDTVTVTATPEQGSFAEGTTFAWFINGEQRDCTAQSYEITFGDNAVANNTIICLAGYNGKYATAGKELTAVEQTALLYTRNGIGYSNLALLNERSSVTNIIYFDSTAYISDFCIDTKTNDAYIIFRDEINTYIEKATYYHALTDMHYAAEDFTFSVPELNLIRMGNDNKLYVKFNLISGGKVFGIVELDETAKTVNIILSLIMHEVTSADQIMSFCVDDAGIMYIAYKDSDNGIQLAKFSIKEGILTKENNILLATISDADNTATSAYFTGISSALTVTDMHYEDGYVYLLVRDASAISRALPKSEVRSLGGVCKIKANDLTFVDNANPLVGWAKTTLNITEENGKNVYNYKHLENETLKEYYFYGPQKIIAVKPKEIVIADDGTYIENSSICPQNRVVVFNLEQNSITDVKTSPKEFFIATSSDTYSPDY